jgi:CBS domain-containing protein
LAKGVPAMTSPAIYQTDFPRLEADDTVGQALDRMLDDRVYDLPVVDADGAFLGMFTLVQVYSLLLPRAALLGHGMEDLTFLSDTLKQLREKMREIEHDAVRDLVVKPDDVIHPDTTPLELVLLLHKGANNVPVVERDSGRLVGMVSARDLLSALRPGEGK